MQTRAGAQTKHRGRVHDSHLMYDTLEGMAQRWTRDTCSQPALVSSSPSPPASSCPPLLLSAFMIMDDDGSCCPLGASLSGIEAGRKPADPVARARTAANIACMACCLCPVAVEGTAGTRALVWRKKTGET